jgi:Outer membrane protein beta-barrel domain
MRFLGFLVTLLFSVSCFAQSGFGPEIGVGASTMHFAPPTQPIAYTAASVSSISSGKVGCVYDVPMNKHIFFQCGVSVSRKGVIRSFSYYLSDSFNEAIHQELYLNYFDVPLAIVYKSGIQGKGRFIAGLGGTPSYLLGGRNKLHDRLVFRDTLTVTDDNAKIVAGKTFSGFDIGVYITAGYELPTGLFFRAYYTAGVNDISRNTEIDKNRILGISAGYIFGRGRNINKETDDLIDRSAGP